MKRTILILLIIVTSSLLPTYGQYRKQLQQYSAGIILGANLTDIKLSAECYSIYSHRWTPHPIVGGFFQYRSEEGFTIRPEMVYFGRGGGLSCQDVNYQLLAHCLSIRVGMRIDYVVPKLLFTLYGVVTPEVLFTLGGDVDYNSKNTGALNMSLSRSNMSIIDLGAFCGMGLEYPVFFHRRAIYISGEIGYHLNFINNLTSHETAGDITILNYINMPPPAQMTRLIGGFELTVRVGIPFGKFIKIKRL